MMCTVTHCFHSPGLLHATIHSFISYLMDSSSVSAPNFQGFSTRFLGVLLVLCCDFVLFSVRLWARPVKEARQWFLLRKDRFAAVMLLQAIPSGQSCGLSLSQFRRWAYRSLGLGKKVRLSHHSALLKDLVDLSILFGGILLPWELK